MLAAAKRRAIDSISTQGKVNERKIQDALGGYDDFEERGTSSTGVSSNFAFVMKLLANPVIGFAMSQILKQQLLRLNWFKETLMSAAMSYKSRERLIKKVGDGSFFTCSTSAIEQMAKIRNMTVEQFGLHMDNCIEQKIEPYLIKGGAEQALPKVNMLNEEDVVLSIVQIMGLPFVSKALGKFMLSKIQSEPFIVKMLRLQAGIDLKRLHAMLASGALFACLGAAITNLGPGPNGKFGRQEFVHQWQICEGYDARRSSEHELTVLADKLYDMSSK